MLIICFSLVPSPHSLLPTPYSPAASPPSRSRQSAEGSRPGQSKIQNLKSKIALALNHCTRVVVVAWACSPGLRPNRLVRRLIGVYRGIPFAGPRHARFQHVRAPSRLHLQNRSRFLVFSPIHYWCYEKAKPSNRTSGMAAPVEAGELEAGLG